MLTFIWAEDERHQIGLNGHLPWNLPGDLHHFKELTIGHPIIMGRKTFNGLPQILSGRPYLVLTRNHDLARQYADYPQAEFVFSISDLQNWVSAHRHENIYVIGGNSVFQALKSQVDCLEETKIKATFEADTMMTSIDYRNFTLVKKISNQADDYNHFSYDFLTFLRKK
ncbi:dihydrofolate reductase [Lactobacillus sp. ESL0684]|uniref:dihydrofolate reductase n=1 Tax=Lactobacillus sp. ESL0684 TaxID=2983213 RepID=UPI0023F89993|nr:dihydrofolate reductase [Lactobacillus sp. ESL0684]WEV44392.1 dihydrofolate reductase [Lactobacillus sp. ESL0684]